MKLDLCKLFGVEEREEFKIKNAGCNEELIFKIQDNVLLRRFKNDIVSDESYLRINSIINAEIIKLPKKKQFTDDELCILRNIDKEYKWLARDDNGDIYIFEGKPKNYYGVWNSDESTTKKIELFNHLFDSITWEDEEPVFIDDYVER